MDGMKTLSDHTQEVSPENTVVLAALAAGLKVIKGTTPDVGTTTFVRLAEDPRA